MNIINGLFKLLGKVLMLIGAIIAILILIDVFIFAVALKILGV